MPRTVLPILAATCLCFGSGNAQQQGLLVPGSRIQVLLPEAEFQTWSPRGQLLRGRLQSITADTLYLNVTDSLAALAVPSKWIRRLYVSRGVPTRPGNALRVGLIWGALSAASTFLLAELSSSDGRSPGEALAVGGAIGFGSGFLFGALYPTERWKRVPLGEPDAPSLSQALQVGVKFAW
jgi:hypothetical protein